MENISEIGNLISSYGFPVVVCLWMFYKEFRYEQSDRQERKELAVALNSLTLAINSLLKKEGVNNE